MDHADVTGERPPLIEYKDVTVVRNRRKVLEGINLRIAVGEHVAILGPNGAGKSSLIKTMTRELYPLAGNPDSYLRLLG
ncbi:MAG: ATP-binding cassette domain-containing protein, partial [Chloroflexota bacterium]